MNHSLKRFIVSVLGAILIAPYRLFAAQPLEKVRAAFTDFG
jgi:hypothetical protein